MEEIKAPKKERKFLKSIGRIAGVLAQELVLGLGRKYIGKMINKIKIPKKRETLSFLLILSCTFAFAQYPTTGNKQRLGYQTTGDGLVWRGRASDTISLKSTGLNNAYIIIDTLQNVMYNYIKTKGGWQFNNTDTVIIQGANMPFDSVFFKTTVPPNNVDTAKMRWDYEKGTVVLGMYDQVPNELGFKNFWLVKNQTGSTITKNSLVYASSTVGASGRISVSKFIANGTIDAKYLLGITAHDLSDGEDGYVISFGKIRQVNTDTFAAGAILYPSPITAGVWTDVEPVAPDLDLPIGFCINSSSNNGTIAIRYASGYKLHELHDLAISSPVDKGSLYYSGGLWRDTTQALLVSDTASMLTNYLRTGVADLNYLKLTGGTLTGNLVVNGTTRLIGSVAINTTTAYKPLEVYGNANDFVSVGVRTLAPYQYTGINFGYAESNTNFRKSAIVFQRNDTQLGAGDASGKVHILNMNVGNAFESATLADAKLTISNTGNVGINDTTPDYQLKVNGTLGVTGATTLSNLAGSGTRMVTASSTGLLSTQSIPTGTVTSVSGSGAISVVNGTTTPVISVADAAFGTAGIVTATGTQQFSGDKVFEGITQFNARAVFKDYTYTATRLAGLSSTDRFATVTLGTGLVLSSGVLSAISGVTSVTASSPLSSSGGTIPNISITDASASSSGVVNTTTQSFAGNKTFTGNVVVSGSSTLNVGSNGTFGGRVNTPWLERTYTTSTATSLTVSVNTTWLNIHQDNLVTLTLPNAATYPGKEFHVKQTGTGQVQSASSNIIAFGTAFNAGSTTQGILIPSGNVRSATLVSDGTYWVIMSRGN